MIIIYIVVLNLVMDKEMYEHTKKRRSLLAALYNIEYNWLSLLRWICQYKYWYGFWIIISIFLINLSFMIMQNIHHAKRIDNNIYINFICFEDIIFNFLFSIMCHFFIFGLPFRLHCNQVFIFNFMFLGEHMFSYWFFFRIELSYLQHFVFF